MSKDNRLGAPTEGLGQTVTFANSLPGSAKQSAGGAGQVNYGTRGDGRANITARQQPLPNAMEGAKTLQVLQRLGGEILKPHIERERQTAFFTGVQRAASGEAVKEIVEEQPWFARVFGDSPVVEGARAFESQSRAQAMATSVEQEMPQLRQLDPAAFQKAMADRMAQLGGSGDDGVDSMVQNSFMQTLPTLMKNHAKEHFGFKQEQYANSVRSAQTAAATRLQQTLSSVTNLSDADSVDAMIVGGARYIGDADVLEAKVNFARSFAPPPGMPPETFAKITAASINGFLSADNLHAYNVLDEAKVIDSLELIDPTKAKQIRDYADRVEGKMRANLPEPMIRMLASIRTLAREGESVQELEQMDQLRKALNASWTTLTGSRNPFIKGETAAELQASLMSGIVQAEKKAEEAAERAATKAATAADKATAEELGMFRALTAVTQGYSLEGVKAEEQRQAWDYLRNDPAALNRARLMQFGAGNFDKVGRDVIQMKVGHAASPEQLEDLYQRELLPMIQADPQRGLSMALAYVGKDNEAMLESYHTIRSTINSKDPTAANQIVAAFDIAKTAKVVKAKPDEATEAVMAVIKKDLTSSLPFVPNTLDERFHREVSELVAPAIRGNSRVSAETALRSAQEQGLRFAGGFFWHERGGPPYIEAVKKAAGVGVAAESVQSYFKDIVDSRAKTLNLDPETVRVVYRDNKGKPTLMLAGVTPEGNYYMSELDPATMGAAVAAEVAKGGVLKRAVKAVTPSIPGINAPAAGPKLTFLPKEGAPSIYDR